MQPQRYDYVRGKLEAESLGEDPFLALSTWIELARVTEGVVEATAMALATAADGRPSNRIVLLRDLDERGLTFFTNYASRKGCELAQNPFAAATFWWPQLERQVRAEGRVERVAESESDAYFAARPLLSRWAALVSPQSQVIEGRDALEGALASVQREFPEGPPRPEDWGGYRLIPDAFEFWQGRRGRLHDRIRFTQSESGWIVERLAP